MDWKFNQLLGVNVEIEIIGEAEVVLKIFSVTNCFEANHPDSLAAVWIAYKHIFLMCK
jgi:hypothetical protein